MHVSEQTFPFGRLWIRKPGEKGGMLPVFRKDRTQSLPTNNAMSAVAAQFLVSGLSESIKPWMSNTPPLPVTGASHKCSLTS